VPKVTKMNRINWSALHQKREWNPFSLFLWFLSLLYSAAVRLRLLAYRNGLLKAKSLPVFVVSIGNITAGGTGKTPFVAMLSDWAARNGLRTAILSRGYKGRSKRESLVVSDGHTLTASVYEAGDEPVLLAKRLPSTPVLISRQRYVIGDLALRLFNSQLLLLDDGFQHLSLHRDLDVLVIDTKRQFGNGSLLPLGPLREPLEGIKRADLIVLSRCNKRHHGDELADFLKEHLPGKPILRSSHLPDQVKFPDTGQTYPPQILAGKKVVAFAGIAHPDDFLEMVTGLGAQVVEFKRYPDHHYFGNGDLETLALWNRRPDVDFLLTTEKDWVRIEGTIGDDLNIAVLTIKMELLEDSHVLFNLIERGIRGSKGLTNEGHIKE
jgi:tetraacyldisaccharide 4'-kinase